MRSNYGPMMKFGGFLGKCTNPGGFFKAVGRNDVGLRLGERVRRGGGKERGADRARGREEEGGGKKKLPAGRDGVTNYDLSQEQKQ